MALAREVKREVVSTHRRHETDTGSAEVQIALLTGRIQELTEHLKQNRKDHACRRGLLKMVGQRSGLLKYLTRTAPARYAAIVQRLGLRR